MRPFGVFITFSILLIFSSFDNESKWELAKEKNGIRVFTRKIEGSNIKEFKAVSYVKTEMHLLVDLIENINDYPNWQANITTSTILKNLNKTEMYFRTTSDLPWPIMDRDMVVFCKKTETEGSVIFNIESKPNYISENEGFLRLQKLKGKWQFKKRDKDKIQIIYQFYGDPGGSLPNWLINAFIVDGPYETLTNIANKFENN